MNWSLIQSSILTGGGRLEAIYQAPRFPWRPEELPHHHKVAVPTNRETIFVMLENISLFDFLAALAQSAWFRFHPRLAELAFSVLSLR